MKRVICHSHAVALGTGTPSWIDVVGGFTISGGNFDVIWRAAGTFRNLVIDLQTAPGSGKSWLFELLINGVAAASVTITNTATTGRYTASDLPISAGQTVVLKVTPSGSPTGPGVLTWSLESECNTANESCYASRTAGLGGDAIATNYWPVFRISQNTSATAPNGGEKSVVAAAGTISGYSILLNTTYGGGTGRDVVLVKNGTRQDGTGGTPNTVVSLVNAVSGAASFSLPVVGGDLVWFESDDVSGSYGGRDMSFSVTFVATTNGESQFCGIPSDDINTSAGSEFISPSAGNASAWGASEGFPQLLRGGVTTFGLKKLYVSLASAPGSGKNRVFTMRHQSADAVGGQVVTIADLATTGADTVGQFTIADGETFSLKETASVGSPTSTLASWALIQVIGAADPDPDPDPGPGADTVGASGIIEMCFHRGTSFRTWIKYRGLGDALVAVGYWWLGDVQTLKAFCDIREAPQQGAHGTYEVIPTKVYGLIPEYGLATWFDGAVQRVTTLTGLSGTGGTFTLIALIRPDAAGMTTADQCIYQTGAVGSAYLGLNATNQPVFGVNGGTLITSTLEVEADKNYVLVGTYDGSDGTLFAAECVIDATLHETGPAALTFTADHDIGTIGSNENADYFTGAIQHVAELEDVLDLEDFEGLHSTTFWTDVTPDVEGVLTSDIGIHDDHPLARIAAAGQLRLTMDNSELNSAGLEGYYSPDHANVREGFQRGIPIRFSLFDQGSPTERIVQFIGTIRSIRPTPGIYLERRTAILATDWLDEAARSTLRALAVQTNVTADEVVGHILNSMRNRPHAIDLQEGTDTYTIALHNATDERTTAQAELLKVAQSELGLIYVRGDGTLVLESRRTRSTAADVDHTMTDFLTVDQDDATDQAKNLIKVTAHPSRLGNDPAAVLYSQDATASPSDPAIQLDNGVNLEVFLPFRDLDGQETVRVGATEIIDPAPTTDYLINTLEDGSGGDLTGNALITLSFTLGGNGVYLHASNQYGQPVFITFLQIRGRAVYDFEPITAIAKNTNNIDEIGEQELALDMPYQSQVGIAQGAADFLLNSLRERQTRLKSVTFWGDYSSDHRQALIHGGISTRVHASELMSGVSGEYFVNAKRIEWKPSGDDGLGDIDCTFYVAEANIGQFWVLDESALDETTRLAYL